MLTADTRFMKAYPKVGYREQILNVSMGAAIQNMMLAANALGLGLSWGTVDTLNRDMNPVKRINETIVSCSGTTTLLSQQLLRHAAKGETNERVGELLDAILAGTAPDVERGVEEVLQIGETSGIDMMVGILLGVQLGLEMKG